MRDDPSNDLTGNKEGWVCQRKRYEDFMRDLPECRRYRIWHERGRFRWVGRSPIRAEG